MNDAIKIAILSLIFFSFKPDFKKPTNPMPVLDMARAPPVAIPRKVDRSKPNLSKALRTSAKILQCSTSCSILLYTVVTEVSSVSLNSLSTPFINIANCAESFTSVLSSIAKLHDTISFSLCLYECHKYHQQVYRCALLSSNAINLVSRTSVQF